MIKFMLFASFFFAIIAFLTPIPSFAIFIIILYFFSIAYIMYLLGATFLAIIILVVYVGAIAILFVFCVILFERTPIYSNYFYFRSVFIFFSFTALIGYFAFFFSPSLTSQLRVKYSKYFTPDNNLFWPKFSEFSSYPNQFDYSFLDSFSSFFFATDQGLLYIIIIGFFLFFFTLGVTYIFYFTKK